MSESLTDKHHLLWNRADWNGAGSPYYDLRSLIVAKGISRVAHNDLHAEMSPPPIPERSTARGLFDHLLEQQFSEPLDSAHHAVDYLATIKRPDSLPLARHIGEQICRLRGSFEL